MQGMRQTIDLDCPPGAPRPADLIEGILEGTGLKVPEHPTPFFGAVTYTFEMDGDEWAEKIQPIVRPRIEALYHSGAIRYGSW